MSVLGLAVMFVAGALLGAIAMSGSTLLTRKRSGPSTYGALLRSGLARAASSDPGGAAAALGRACEVDSNDDAVFVLLAEQLRLSGSADRARKTIDVVLARRDLQPEVSSAAWLVRGRLLEDEERQREALASYATAIEVDPQAVEPLVARGRLLSAMRLWEDAIVCAEKLAKLQPERGRRIASRRRILLAREKLAEGDAREALALAEAAVKEGSENGAAQLTLGDAHFQTGQSGPAATAWTQAARDLPALAPLVLDRLEQIASGSDARDRARAFAKDVAVHPGAAPSDVWRVFAWLTADALRRGRRDRARRWLERLGRAAPGRAATARLSLLVDGPDEGHLHGLDGVLRWDPWRCRRCGEELADFEWRCPRCRAWASLR